MGRWIVWVPCQSWPSFSGHTIPVLQPHSFDFPLPPIAMFWGFCKFNSDIAPSKLSLHVPPIGYIILFLGNRVSFLVFFSPDTHNSSMKISGSQRFLAAMLIFLIPPHSSGFHLMNGLYQIYRKPWCGTNRAGTNFSHTLSPALYISFFSHFLILLLPLW